MVNLLSGWPSSHVASAECLRSPPCALKDEAAEAGLLKDVDEGFEGFLADCEAAGVCDDEEDDEDFLGALLFFSNVALGAKAPLLGVAEDPKVSVTMKTR